MLKALIVDDDITVIQCISTLINWKEIGYTKVYTAMNGQEAFELASKESIDVIISDLKMPVMGGVELARKLRESGIETEIILLTAYEDFRAARDGIELRIYDYMLKPLVMETLQHLSENLCSIAQKRKNIKWVDRFVRDEFDGKIIEAFENCNADYIRNLFETIGEIDSSSEGERLFHLSVIKLVTILCDYYRKNSFSEKSIKYNKDKILEQVKELKSRQEVIDLLLVKFVAVIQSTKNNPADFENRNLALEIKKYISQNFMYYTFGIAEISKHFHYSRDHINRIFKDSEGISINKYIIDLRMEKARALVFESDMTVNEISKAVGYNSTSYFISSFRSKFGVTPSEIRENNRYTADISES